jgi:hypothetical protein
VSDILLTNKPARTALAELMERTLKAEQWR